MISPKKIHAWIVKALEEPLFTAEMHRADILRQDVKEPQLQLIEGGKSRSQHAEPSDIKRVSGLATRTQ